MTYLEIAEEVLNTVGTPLKVKEIWDYAVSLGINQLKDIAGKTPESTLSAQIYTNIKDNPKTTIFVQTGPNTFALKTFVKEKETIFNVAKIALVLQKVKNLKQLTLFLNLVKFLTESFELNKEDKRLVCTSTRSKRLSINVNLRLVLAIHFNDATIALTLENEDVPTVQELSGYVRIRGYFSNKMSFVEVDLAKAEKVDYDKWIELWKKAVLKELNAAVASPYRRANDMNLYFVATNEELRKETFSLIQGESNVEDNIEDEYEDDIEKPLLEPIHQDVELIEDKWSVYDHIRKIKNNRLILDVEFQRTNEVWTKEQKSKFIESILMGFPLPPFYLNARSGGAYIIIDGLQRTTTLNQYLNDEFTLTGLKALKYLNDKTFTQLPTALQAKIEDKGLYVYILKITTPTRVIYELFDRINTGGTKLNRQEVRNCLFIGKSTELLKELAGKSYFKEVIDSSISSTRMRDREIILRYLSFKILGYENYSGDLSPFLERAMEIINEMTDTQIEELRVDFKHVMEWAFKIFADQSFRIPLLDENGNNKGRGALNVSILESICYFLSKYRKDFLDKHKDNIRKNYRTLVENPKYLEAVKISTGNKQRVLDRFSIADKILSQI